jgi:hypothetical protein
MQVRDIRARYAWWILGGLFVAAALILGCENRDVVVGIAPNETIEKIPDRSETTSRGQSNLYGLGNPFVTSTVSRLVALRPVANAIERLDLLGLKLDPGGSFILEWIDNDGAAVATFISATAGPSGSESAIIACIERGGQLAVAPAIFSSSPSKRSGEYRKIADELWMNPVPFGRKSRSSEGAARFDDEFWNDFWNCVVIHIPTEAAACTVSCAFVFSMYPQCLVTCISTQAVTTAVRCFLSTSLAQSIGGKDLKVE